MWKILKCVGLDIIVGNKCNNRFTDFQLLPNIVITLVCINNTIKDCDVNL